MFAVNVSILLNQRNVETSFFCKNQKIKKAGEPARVLPHKTLINVFR